MADVRWNDVAETLAGQYSDLPFVVLARNVRDGVRRVCRNTLVWEVDCPPRPLGAGQYRYELDAGDDEREVTAVLRGHLIINYRGEDETGKMLQAVDRKDAIDGKVAAVDVGWPHLGQPGEPNAVMMWEEGQFALAPTPGDDAVYGVRLYVALMPSHQAQSVPMEVYSRIEEAVEHATLQRIYAQPQQPWGSARMAAYHGRLARSHEQRVKGGPGTVQVVGRTMVPGL